MPWKPCLICGEETTNYCKQCAQTSNDGMVVNARFYCDTDCRKKDEPEHLKAHMDIRRVMAPNMERAIRAGKVAQSLFYAFLENTWAYDMASVRIIRDQNHELVAVEVTDGSGVVTGPGSQSHCGRYAGGWLIKFPDEAFSAFNDDAKYALLTDHASIWAFVVMHVAVQVLFQDLVEDVQTDIKEVVHYPSSKASRIVQAQGSFGFETRRQDLLYPDVDQHGDTKGVFEITLKDGSKIALDLAGAQWELPDGLSVNPPVTYWADYWSRWGAAIKYHIPFRSHQLKHAAKMTNYRMITAQTVIMEMNLYFNILMAGGCKAGLGFHLHDLPGMDTETFRSAKQRLFIEVERYLQWRPQEIDTGNHRNVFDNFDLRHPKAIPEPPVAQLKSNGSLPFDIGSMEKFDWKDMSRLIQMPSSEVGWREKKRAIELKKKRSVYKMPDDWRVTFLEDTIPGPKVPVECVSENPGWKLD